MTSVLPKHLIKVTDTLRSLKSPQSIQHHEDDTCSLRKNWAIGSPVLSNYVNLSQDWNCTSSAEKNSRI